MASVVPSGSVAMSTGTNTTNTCAAPAAPVGATGRCVGTDCPFSNSTRPTQLQVVSDTTGLPVQGTPAVSAALTYGCQGMNIDVLVTDYFDKISEGSSGWFDLPMITGAFNLTVDYGGQTYLFGVDAYPGSTTCVSLSVPSGAVSLAVYQFSDFDCAGNLEAGAGQSSYGCFGEVYLRVLSDSDQVPVAGANVTTNYDFTYTCGSEASKSFTTTTSTAWYVFGDSGNSFTVSYGGQNYIVTPSERSGSTCETLHVPSGAIDTTYGANCAVTGSTSTSTTLSSSTTSTSSPCNGGGPNTSLNTITRPTAYVKVVDDQGVVITNGTLIVTQLENMTRGEEISNYCMSLSDVQATGYLRLPDLNQSGSSASLITGGNYNVTLTAYYGLGLEYTTILPSIQLGPNSIVYVTVSVPSGTVTMVTSNVGSSELTTTTTSATTVTTTTNNLYNCGGWVYRLSPEQNSSLYLKMVTSQGMVITNNGTLFVFHTAPNGDGYYGGSGEYCLALNGNATGYMGLTANDGLAPIGSYGLTLFAVNGYAHVDNMTIPPITVPAGTTVYVTLVVPSGEVTVVTCSQGSGCTMATFIAVRG